MMGGKVAPPIGTSMSEAQRWNVINYLRFKQGRKYGESPEMPDPDTTADMNQE